MPEILTKGGNMNQITLMGNIGKNAWRSQKGESLDFTLATTESWKDKEDQWQSRTDWHYCKIYGAKKDFLESRLKAGCKVLLVGQQKNRMNQNQETKELETFSYVNVKEIKIVDPKSKEDRSFTFEDIPF